MKKSLKHLLGEWDIIELGSLNHSLGQQDSDDYNTIGFEKCSLNQNLFKPPLLGGFIIL